jgi:UDP-glucose 4-epimerase
LRTATCKKAYGEVFNVGTGVPINFIELAEKIVQIAGTGKVTFTEFTQERKEVEPGDYYTNISKIKRIVGWEPETSLEEGLRKTIGFYRKYKKEYW